ncbi:MULTISPECIES: thiol:disulfide interchange protein DsbA/DsbL [Glaesserella]|uniref:Thiol disulfide oxidoreductase n=1 Tax=Glaesserella australis TaxID=2094024 RepID=A0A328C1Z6_9PAST|nr:MULTISPECIES: thiol:disulfide interchange protein DsbA/DsbL [Glaesserella]AUI66749.1 thiol disulfide oxidoreductase [Glaesserella sp. 15-184]RAL19801.1 thiol disulfide oxidoreductase [Glaesserella australis]
MKIKQKLFCLISLVAFSSVLFAQETSKEPLFKDGKGYYSYKSPLKITLPNDGKVLITYFYQYGCQVCLDGDDYIKQYVARNSDKVVLERIAVPSDESKISMGLNAIFEVLGRPELSDLYLFDSAYKDQLIKNDQEIRKWLVTHHISLEEIEKVRQSVAYKQKLIENRHVISLYTPSMIPMAVLNGKYILLKNTLYNDDYTFAVLDFLVDKLHKEQEKK